MSDDEEVDLDLPEQSNLHKVAQEGEHKSVLVLAACVVELQVKHRRKGAAVLLHLSEVQQQEVWQQISVLWNVVPVPVERDAAVAVLNAGKVCLQKVIT
jgi:hypothetical protein